MNTATAHKPGKDEISTASNFGDFQSGCYTEALARRYFALPL